MAGYISEFFGYRAEDSSAVALCAANQKRCPFLGTQCTKVLSRDRTVSGVCSIHQSSDKSPDVICCPIRIYADDYKMLKTIARSAFKKEYNLYSGRAAVARAKNEGGAIAVFGHGWGGELRLPQRKGTGSYFVDWVLALLDEAGELIEFTAIEVQTIDTTGNYREARAALLKDRSLKSDTVGLNWENVSKRIIPQLIYKGQVLQREDLCRTGLYFVCPRPVYDRVLNRLGGKDKIPKFPTQPASIHFISYDYLSSFSDIADGEIVPLGITEEHCTTVYKVQEAFSAMDLPEGNVYRDAIRRSLYGNEE
ncbi:restriction endonuclease NotI [Shuttleworthella sp. MSX8B]|uniref:NotI family restriction endonuclease n=1 Tax=Shuttleworthella sp. MSX8B TaxID=936574 RepID=UPI0004471262|nr:NotI family restriction endonuclease [Shuttleworthia sp. MSX8B]EUB16430.1 restriction endonuclease NotI [Shuttleworthia sp. MSX8B]